MYEPGPACYSRAVNELFYLLYSALFNFYSAAFVYSKLNLIFKVFKCRSVDFLCKLYVVYVRPLLEYGSSVWNPHSLEDCDRIERVQKFFTRRLPGMGNLNYIERLIAVNLEPLELRRIRADLLLAFKIVRGFADIDASTLFVRNMSAARGHSFKLFVPRSSKSVRQNSFACRIVPVWNSLPDSVVSAPTVSSFKRRLIATNLNNFLVGRTLRDL